ncbi:MAG: hypothetical protein ACI915_002466 [Gammaproteobacteria bacterium]|jgi:hypothetical protein
MIVSVKAAPSCPEGRAIVRETVSCVLVGLAIGSVVGILLFSLTFALSKASG